MLRYTAAVLVLAWTTCAWAEPPEAAIVGIASVRVAEVYDAAAFSEARTLLQTKADRVQAHVRRVTGLAPSEIERATFVFYRLSTHDGETTLPVIVVVPRKAVTVAALAEAMGRRVGEKLPELAGFTRLVGEPAVAVSGTAIVIFPFETSVDDTAAAMGSIMAKAVQCDRERAADLARQQLVASLIVDMPEVLRYLGSGFQLDGTPRGFPEELRAMQTARVAAFQLKLAKTMTFTGEIRFISGPDASLARPALELILKRMQRLLDDEASPYAKGQEFDVLRAFADELLTATRVTVSERTVRLTANREVTAATTLALAGALVKLESANGRGISQSNLQRLAAAVYGTDLGENPLLANICDARGKPLLSWRVRLLPFLDERELYEQFRLDEPWDSEHNRKLAEKMPSVFAFPTAKPAKAGTTFYQAFTGRKGAMIRPVLQDGDADGLNLESIRDGTNNTILFAEAAEAVEWTKPADIAFDPDAKAPTLGGHFLTGFNIVFADCTARFLKSTLSEKMLKAMITANGGEEVIHEDEPQP